MPNGQLLNQHKGTHERCVLRHGLALQQWQLIGDDVLTLCLLPDVQVPKAALQTLFQGDRLQLIAQKVLQLSKAGLQRRGRGEEKYLDPLLEIADSGVTLAERMLQQYNTAWGHSLDPLYAGDYDY